MPYNARNVTIHPLMGHNAKVLMTVDLDCKGFTVPVRVRLEMDDDGTTQGFGLADARVDGDFSHDGDLLWKDGESVFVDSTDQYELEMLALDRYTEHWQWERDEAADRAVDNRREGSFE